MHMNIKNNSTRINYWQPRLLAWIQHGRHYELADMFFFYGKEVTTDVTEAFS